MYKNDIPTAMQQEFRYLLDFIEESDLTVHIIWEQIRSLCTAFCLHCNLDVDTFPYDWCFHRLLEQAWNNENFARDDDYADVIDDFFSEYLC